MLHTGGSEERSLDCKELWVYENNTINCPINSHSIHLQLMFEAQRRPHLQAANQECKLSLCKFIINLHRFVQVVRLELLTTHFRQNRFFFLANNKSFILKVTLLSLKVDYFTSANSCTVLHYPKKLITIIIECVCFFPPKYLCSLLTHKKQYHRSQWHHLEKAYSKVIHWPSLFPLHKNLSTPHSIQFHPNYIIQWEKKWASESVKHAVRRNQSRLNWLWQVIVLASSEKPEGTSKVSRGQIRGNFRLIDVQRHRTMPEIFGEERGAISDLVRRATGGSVGLQIKEHRRLLSSLHTCFNIILTKPLKYTRRLSWSLSHQLFVFHHHHHHHPYNSPVLSITFHYLYVHSFIMT